MIFKFFVSKESYKQYVSSFSEVFAKLIFLPKKALEEFGNKSLDRKGCNGEGSPNQAKLEQGQARVCISIRPAQENEK